MVDIVIEPGLSEEEDKEARMVADRALFGYITRCVNRSKRISVRKDRDEWVIDIKVAKPENARTRPDYRVSKPLKILP